MRTLAKYCSTVIVFLCFGMSIARAQNPEAAEGQTGMFRMVEAGGQSLAFLVAMYWLKDSNERRVRDVSDVNERRVEDANRQAEVVRELKHNHKEEILKLYESQTREITEFQGMIKIMMEKLFVLAHPREAGGRNDE